MSSIYRTLTYVVCLSTGILWFPQPYSYLCNYLLFIQRYISTMNGICKEALSYVVSICTLAQIGRRWFNCIIFMMLGISRICGQIINSWHRTTKLLILFFPIFLRNFLSEQLKKNFSLVYCNPVHVQNRARTVFSLCSNSHRKKPVFITGNPSFHCRDPVFITGMSMWKLLHRLIILHFTNSVCISTYTLGIAFYKLYLTFF